MDRRDFVKSSVLLASLTTFVSAKAKQPIEFPIIKVKENDRFQILTNPYLHTRQDKFFIGVFHFNDEKIKIISTGISLCGQIKQEILLSMEPAINMQIKMVKFNNGNILWVQKEKPNYHFTIMPSASYRLNKKLEEITFSY